MIKKLLDLGDQYARESTWKDFALTKLCLFSMGLAAGTMVKKQYRPAVLAASAAGFAASYIPLMAKVFRIALRKED